MNSISNKQPNKCCEKFHEEGVKTGIDFINAECDCPCHRVKEGVTEVNGWNSALNTVLSLLDLQADTLEKSLK